MLRVLTNFIKRIFIQLFDEKKQIKLGFYGPPNGGKCVTPDTEIVFYNGEIRPIGEVFQQILQKPGTLNIPFGDVKEHYIDTSNMNLIVPSLDPITLKIIPKKISFVYQQHYQGDIYNITTRNGRTARLTPNHPLITLSDQGVQKIRSADLTVGASVALARNLQLSSITTLLPVTEERFNIQGNTIQALSKFKKAGDMQAPTYIDDDLVRFIGYVITESYHQNNRIKFSNTDQNILNDFDYITEKLFRLPTIHRINKGVPEREINSKTLTEYLKETLNFQPHTSEGKEIPSQLMGLDNNLTGTLLRVLFDCDGYVPKECKKWGATLEYSSKSKKLVDQVQLLLNRFGIVGRFKKKMVDGETYWSLFIGGSDNHRTFRDHIGFTIDYKIERLNTLCQLGEKRNKFTLPIVNRLEDIRKKMGMLQKNFFLDGKHIARMRKLNRITYNRLEKMSKNIQEPFINTLAQADTMWDEIATIKKEHYDGYVYDLTIDDTHTFVLSNGLIAHNTTLSNKICKDWLGEEIGVASKIPHETRSVTLKDSVVIKHRGKELGFTLVDTPGIATKIDYEEFIKFKMPEAAAKKRAKEATKGVIEAIKWLDEMDCVVVVLDATKNPYSQVNVTIIGNLAARDIPVLIVANKIDLKKANIKKVENAFPQYDVVGLSALEGTNIEEFYESLFRLIKKR